MKAKIDWSSFVYKNILVIMALITVISILTVVYAIWAGKKKTDQEIKIRNFYSHSPINIESTKLKDSLIATKIELEVLKAKDKTNIYGVSPYPILLLFFLCAMMILLMIHLFGMRSLAAKDDLDRLKLELQVAKGSINAHFIKNLIDGPLGLPIYKYGDLQSINIYNQMCRFTVLHYAILQKDMVPLSEEINYLNAYMVIEHARFRDKLINIPEVENFNVSNELLETVRIPVMLIQPFIENAFKHGVSTSKRDNMVYVTLKDVNESIEIWIEDIGEGMSDEDLAFYNSYFYKKATKNIEKSTSMELNIGRMGVSNNSEPERRFNWAFLKNGKGGLSVLITVNYF